MKREGLLLQNESWDIYQLQTYCIFSCNTILNFSMHLKLAKFIKEIVSFVYLAEEKVHKEAEYMKMGDIIIEETE